MLFLSDTWHGCQSQFKIIVIAAISPAWSSDPSDWIILNRKIIFDRKN